MATVAIPRAERREETQRTSAPERATIDNEREETIGRFALVLMMPIVLAATLAAIMFWLVTPLQ